MQRFATSAVFGCAYTRADIPHIPFKPEWNNGDSQFDHAVNGNVHNVALQPGRMVKSETPNERKMIFVGTPLGTIVIFECYPKGETGAHVYNAHRKLQHYFRNLLTHRLTESNLRFLLGNDEGDPNIGIWLQALGMALLNH